MKRPSLFFTACIQKLYVPALSYIGCILLTLGSCFSGKTQMTFESNQPAHFIAVGPTNDLGFIITDPGISANLAKGFEFQVIIDTDILGQDPDNLYKVFSIGFYGPSNENAQIGIFCAVIELYVMDENLYVCRVIKEESDELKPMRAWRLNMVPNDMNSRTIKFTIDSFATKIYNHHAYLFYKNDQACELSFWGLLGSEAKRVFENPCFSNGVPAVLVPVDQPHFIRANLYPYSHINLSPVSSNAGTGGNTANPQSRTALQEETCNCAADSSFPRKKNSNWKRTKIPKIPRYRTTTAVVSEDKKGPINVSSFKWKIYPNPTTDKINLETNSPDNLDATVDITDEQGRRVYTSNINITKGISHQTISLRDISAGSGIYFIRLRSVNSKVIPEKEQTRKIILQ